MTTEISDYLDVPTRARELGLLAPTDITILPHHFEQAERQDQLRTSTEASSFRTLLRQAELPLGSVTAPGQKLIFMQNNSFAFLAPALFVSAALVTQNPTAINIMLGVIANYVTDFLKGYQNGTVKLEIVAETRQGAYKKVRYDGDTAGLAAVAEVVKAVVDE